MKIKGLLSVLLLSGVLFSVGAKELPMAQERAELDAMNKQMMFEAMADPNLSQEAKGILKIISQLNDTILTLAQQVKAQLDRHENA